MKHVLPTLTFLVLLFTAHSGHTQVPEYIDVPLTKGVFDRGHFHGDHFIAVSDYGVTIWHLENEIPEFVARIYLPYFNGLTRLVSSESTLYIVQPTYVFAINISDIQNPGMPEILLDSPDAHYVDIDLKDDFLFVTDQNESGLQVYDVSNPINPLQVTEIVGPGLSAVNITNSYVYLTGNNALKRYSFTGTELVFIDEAPGNEEDLYFHAAVNDTLALIKYKTHVPFEAFSGFRFYDFSIEGQPIVVEDMELSMEDLAFNPHVFLRGTALFVEYEEILRIYNLDNYNVSFEDSLTISEDYFSAMAANETQFALLEKSKGFRIFDPTGPFEYTEAHVMRTADDFRDVEVSSNQYMFVQGSDTVYVGKTSVIDPVDPTDPFRSFYFEPGNTIKVLENYFLEGTTTSFNLSDLYLIEDNSEVQHIEVITGSGAGDPERYKMWDNKLCLITTSVGMEEVPLTKIYDLDNLTNPPIAYVYDHLVAFQDDIFYALPLGLNGMVRYYDATTSTPALIDSIDVMDEVCGAYRICEDDRPVCHLWTPMCYTQMVFDEGNASVGSLAPNNISWYLQRDKKLFNNGILYSLDNNNVLHIVDVCDIEHMGLISTLPLNNTVRDMAIKNDTLYIAFPSYVARYDVGHIEPCQIVSSVKPEKEKAGFSVYPNPTAGNIHVEYTAAESQIQINLRNILGGKVHSEVVTCVPGDISNFQLHLEQPAGLYLLEIVDGKNTAVEKVVVR